MRLEAISFVSFENLGKLVLGCPLLETLVVNRCSFGHCKSLTISSSRLKHLEMTFFDWDDDIQRYPPCNITVSTPKLIYLKCLSPIWMMHGYSLGNMSSLMNADIGFYDSFARYRDGQFPCAQKVINFLRVIANVKSLFFSRDLHKWLVQAVFEVPQRTSVTFHNLNFLSLTVPRLCRGEISDIAYILEMCPNIERLVLVLSEGISIFQRETKCEAADLPSSRCMLLHLKHVEIHNAIEGIDELDKFNQFLNKSMANLEKFVVIPS